MNKERHFILAAVFCILEKDGQVLLSQRLNTGHKDGEYSLPAGHVDADELPKEALVREVKEEIGVDINIDSLKFVQTYWHDIKGKTDYINVFFTTSEWSGEVKNCEPKKCSDLSWFPVDNLPENTIDYVRTAISALKNKEYYIEIRYSD